MYILVEFPDGRSAVLTVEEYCALEEEILADSLVRLLSIEEARAHRVKN
jgi:hypothetical protein